MRQRLDAATLTVAGLTVVALVLRLACIKQSLFGDELFLYSDVHGHSLSEVFSQIHDTEKTPPLYFVLGWIFARGGDPTVYVRIPALVASVATVPLVYLLGRRTVGQAAGLVAAAWFALSPFQIFYGTEARGYSLAACLVVLSTLGLLRALDGRGRWAWALYVVATVAAIYTHYIAALVLIPQAAWALWTHRERVRAQLIANGVVVLLWLPWLPSFIVQARHSGGEGRRIDAISPLTLGHAAKTGAQSLVGHPYARLGSMPGVVPLVILGALLVALAVWLRPRRDVWLLAILAVTAPVAVILYSALPHRSFLLPRNVEVAVPYALLLFGLVLTSARRPVAIGASIAALACVGEGSVKMLEAKFQRPDGRSAARFIDARAPAGAPVLDFPGPQGTQFYFERPHPLPAYASFGEQDWAAAARAGRPVFVTSLKVGILVNLGPPPGQAARFRLAAEHTTPGTPAPLTVREFTPR